MQQQSVKQLVEKIKVGEISSEEVCAQYLQTSKSKNSDLNAYLEIYEDVIEKAQAKDKSDEKKGALFGVPIAVKDNFCVKGMKTTAASKILGNFVAPYTAHCISRLIDEGAVIIGRTNMDEFAMGSSNENSGFGPCKNPWNTKYVPGGSSGGSAAAVAAGMAPLSIGSDTGGSIRQPASFCGVVGIKPSYGSISRYGMIAFASSLDQAGTFGQSVEDAALALQVMIGKDFRDSTNVETQYSDLTESLDLNGKTFGLPKEYLGADIDPSMRESFEALLEKLKASGAQIKEVSLPHTEHAIPVYYLISASEASSNLSRYDGVRYGLRDISSESGQPVSELSEFYKLTRSRGFGDEVKRRILLGTFSLSAGYYDAFYTKACQVRRLISEDFVSAFKDCDALLTPIATNAAFALGDKTQDPLAMYYNDIFTAPASLAGLPALSLPLGQNKEGMPFGLQMIGPQFKDDRLIGLAQSVEKLIGFTGRPS